MRKKKKKWKVFKKYKKIRKSFYASFEKLVKLNKSGVYRMIVKVTYYNKKKIGSYTKKSKIIRR